MANQINNLLLLDLTDGITRTIDTATPDVIQVGVDFELISGASLTVAGNLTVNGTTTTVDSENVLIADNYLYLNNGYTVDTPESGGFVVNYDPTTTTDTVAAGGFATTSTVITTATGTFSVGDIIQISGAADPSNNGVFEVVSHVGTTLTIDTTPTEDFSQNTFVVDAADTGATITNINVSVLRVADGTGATTAGDWEAAKGSTVPLSYTALSLGAGAATLQTAYENGNTITTDATNGNVTITGTQDFLVTTSDVDMDVSGSITLDAVTTIGIGTDADDSSINIGTVTTAGRAIALGNNTGTTSVLIDTGSGGLTMDSDGIWDVDVAGNITIDQDPQAATSGTSGYTVDWNVGAGGTGTAGVTPTAAGAGGTFTLDGGTGGAGTGTGTGGETGSDAGAGGAVTIQGGTGGAGSAGAVDPGQAGDGGLLTLCGGAGGNGAGTSDNGSGGGISICGGAAGTGGSGAAGTAGDVNLGTTDTNNINIGSTHDGDIILSGTDNNATSIDINAGGLDYITIDSTDGAEQIIFHQDVRLEGAIGRDFLVGTGGITVGDILTFENGLSGVRVIPADANDPTEEERYVVAIAAETVAATGTALCYTIHGSVVKVTMDAAPAAGDIGSRVYLSTTPGTGSLTAPTGSGRNIFVVGILAEGDGASNPVDVIFMPQFIARRP